MTRNPASFELEQLSLDPREFAGILSNKTIRGIRKILLEDGPAVRLILGTNTQYVLRPEFWTGDRILVAAPNIMGTNRPITDVLTHEGRSTFTLYLKHRMDTLAIITTTNNSRGGGDHPEGGYPIGLYRLHPERTAA